MPWKRHFVISASSLSINEKCIWKYNFINLKQSSLLVSYVSAKVQKCFFSLPDKVKCLFSDLFVCFKFSSTEKFTSQEDKLSALKSGKLIRIESPRARPNLERTYSKKGFPVVQKLTAPDEEGMNQGEHLPLAEESENLLSSKVRFYFWLHLLMLGSKLTFLRHLNKLLQMHLFISA